MDVSQPNPAGGADKNARQGRVLDTAVLAGTVRAAHRAFPTGVTIVTAFRNGRPYGLAVNAFSSVSLEPPMVLVCVASTAKTYARLFDADEVAVNILAHDQLKVAGAFARSGGEKFAGLRWRRGLHGAPLIDGAASSFELEVKRRIVAGTHTIFICAVLRACASEKSPLIYLGGRFFDGARLQEAG